MKDFLAWFAGEGHAGGEILYWCSQIALAAIALIAAGFAYSQIKTFKLFELLKFLQDERIVTARRAVRREISKKDSKEEWWETDSILEAHASMACTGYDVLGLYLRSHWLDPWLPKSLTKFFVKYWCYSIVDIYVILKPFIQARRAQHGEKYFEGYQWIFERAERYASKERPNPVTS